MMSRKVIIIPSHDKSCLFKKSPLVVSQEDGWGLSPFTAPESFPADCKFASLKRFIYLCCSLKTLGEKNSFAAKTMKKKRFWRPFLFNTVVEKFEIFLFKIKVFKNKERKRNEKFWNEKKKKKDSLWDSHTYKKKKIVVLSCFFFCGKKSFVLFFRTITCSVVSLKSSSWQQKEGGSRG